MAKVIQITSKLEGFRRCGIAHSATTTSYPQDRFTKAELEQLKAEPMLVVHIVEPRADAAVNELETLKVKCEALSLQLADSQAVGEKLTQELAEALRDKHELEAKLAASVNVEKDLTEKLTATESENEQLRAEVEKLKAPAKKAK